ncbi:Signal recognition particle protein [compost metagenome]
MGDMLSLIEKAQAEIDTDKAKEMERKMRNAEFTFDDFLEQMAQVKKLGPIDQIMDMIPGMGKMKQMQDVKVDEKQMDRVEAIVHSMTKKEKQNPEMINHSRRKRIAAGSGTNLADVNRLIKQFDEMRRMMKQLSGMMGSKGKGSKMLKQMQGKAGKGGFKFPFR